MTHKSQATNKIQVIPISGAKILATVVFTIIYMLSWHQTMNKIAYQICPIFMKLTALFKINWISSSQDSRDEIWTNKKNDKLIDN